ncbi:putative xyloglucan endotransglucosylase/hydrolase protein 32 [Platanthera zijinensis]|uniref:Xyloglucan endotransglucosylase/hydrolase n=1 Tax=Platanthera zijinensis TaxID=2320716 RepID=A0AAP0B9P8_9ASPA
MALLQFFFLFFLTLPQCLINAQPSPGYYPSTKLSPIHFYQAYNSQWGLQHQSVAQDQSSLTFWLDKYSGSGFKSKTPFRSGYFAVSVKLQTGYTAGVNTAFYLSNNEEFPGFHDEVDVEFLGTIPGRPYTLQTNVYVMGSGDGRVIGREMRFHLWFDPTADFHNYAILWNPQEIIFFVDDIPIRQYTKNSDATFPRRPMWVYGSIWDASSWATENGKYKADYNYQPFVSRLTKFLVGGCSEYSAAGCQPPAASPTGYGLSTAQYTAMRWAQQNYKVYDYCSDTSRDHSLTPEC